MKNFFVGILIGIWFVSAGWGIVDMTSKFIDWREQVRLTKELNKATDQVFANNTKGDIFIGEDSSLYPRIVIGSGSNGTAAVIFVGDDGKPILEIYRDGRFIYEGEEVKDTHEIYDKFTSALYGACK